MTVVTSLQLNVLCDDVIRISFSEFQNRPYISTVYLRWNVHNFGVRRNWLEWQNLATFHVLKNLARDTEGSFHLQRVCVMADFLLRGAHDAVESCWLLLIRAETLGFTVEKAIGKKFSTETEWYSAYFAERVGIASAGPGRHSLTPACIAVIGLFTLHAWPRVCAICRPDAERRRLLLGTFSHVGTGTEFSAAKSHRLTLLFHAVFY